MRKTVATKPKRTWIERRQGKRENNRPVLDRLMGVETEYAVASLDEAAVDEGTPPPVTAVEQVDLFWDRLLNAIQAKVPVVPAIGDSGKWFLGNGGNLSRQASLHSIERGLGLVEAATPECRSPSQILCHQIAQDRLISQAVEEATFSNPAVLIKNSADAYGNFYGSHENYEVQIAAGWRLLIYRLGLLALLPCLILYWIVGKGWLATASFLAFMIKGMLKGRQPLGSKSTSENSDSAEADAPWPKWLVRLTVSGLRCLHGPVATLMLWHLRFTAFVPERKFLTAFLISRQAFDGGGHVDENSKFWLSARASNIDTIFGIGSYWGQRPMMSAAHLLESTCGGFFRWSQWRRQWSRRQRLQIAVGDSLVSHWSFFVRMGVTSLVLDMLERSDGRSLLRMRYPLLALRRWGTDIDFTCKCADRRGVGWSALEVQRYYVEAVKQFLKGQRSVSNEAWQVVSAWEATLDQLSVIREEPEKEVSLLCRVDWLTKRHLLDRLPEIATWADFKKLDIRYHELSSDGYHSQVSRAIKGEPMVPADLVNGAMRNPPAGSPAVKRSYLIREFCDPNVPISESELKVNWSTGILRQGGKSTQFSFDSA